MMSLDSFSRDLRVPKILTQSTPLENQISVLDEKVEVLYNAMATANRNSFNYSLVKTAYSDDRLRNRTIGIEWIRKIAKDSWEVRDVSIQILNNYLIISFVQNPNMVEDTSFILYAATAALILGTKLHASNNYLSASNFTGLQLEDIQLFERDVLMKAGSRMSTLATPAYFVDYVVSLLYSEEVGGQVNKEQILQMVNTIIGEFWEDGASLLFAPSTIAISSVIMSLSLLRMDCSKLVDSLPEFLLPNRAFPFFLEEDGKSMYLDVNTCMKAMERLTYIRSTYMTRSPISISEEIKILQNGCPKNNSL